MSGCSPLRRVRRGVAAAMISVLVTAPAFLAGSVTAAAAPSSAPVSTDTAVTVQVTNVQPSSPTSSSTPQPLTFTLALTNTTDTAFPKLTVTAERGDPIMTQAALDTAINHPQPPTPELAVPVIKPNVPPTVVALAAQASRVVTIRTSSDIPLDAGLCICHDAIYPIYFSVSTTANDGSASRLGSGQTLLPVFKDAPSPVRVSWVWPLADVPHRLASPTAFTDDLLAQSVMANGRLDRMLAVLEALDTTTTLTLAIDPELIDELAVMSTGYTISNAKGVPVAGSGTAAAADWLSRLRSVLDLHPGIALEFTPYADPDIQALSENSLAWARTLPTAMSTRVAAALGGRAVATDIVWPTNAALTASGLDSITDRGVHRAILADSQLAHPPTGAQNSLTTLRSRRGAIAAVVTSTPIETALLASLQDGGGGLGALPRLVAQVAVRAVESPVASPFVVLAPPRTLDPDPVVAAAAINATTRTMWSEPITIDAAIASVAPTDYGGLAPAHQAQPISAQTIDSVRYIQANLPALRTMFSGADAARLLGTLPQAIQRVESVAWLAEPSEGTKLANALYSQVNRLVNGVQLVVPADGTYTLGSSDSPLPIAVNNSLDVVAMVRLRLSTVGGVPGFKADDIGIQRIPALGKLPLHVPVHLDRAGRIRVEVMLTTVDGTQLGTPITISVHSTALGEIGKVITIVAGAVLVLALLVRLVRRLRDRRRTHESEALLNVEGAGSGAKARAHRGPSGFGCST